VQHIGPSVESP